MESSGKASHLSEDFVVFTEKAGKTLHPFTLKRLFILKMHPLYGGNHPLHPLKMVFKIFYFEMLKPFKVAKVVQKIPMPPSSSFP